MTQSYRSLWTLVELEGLPEASGVSRWIFLVVLKICVYGPPPILTRSQSRNVIGFFEFLYVALRFVRVSYS